MQVNLTSTKLNNVQRKLYVYTYRCGDKLAKSKKILNIKVHSATNTALTTYDNYCLWAGGIYVIIFCKKILNVKSYHQQQWYKLVVNSLRAVGSCETFYYDKHGTSHSQNHALSIQGIIVLPERKLLQRNLSLQNCCGGWSAGTNAASVNKSTSFCSIFVTPSLLHLGALLRDDLQMGAFS